MSKGGLGDHHACGQTSGHKRKSYEQGAKADFIGYLKRGQAGEKSLGLLGLQGTLLEQVEEAGAEAQDQGGVTGEDQRNMSYEPALARGGGTQDKWLLPTCAYERE